MTATLTSAPPRYRSVPLHVSSAGQDCIDLAAGAGLVLDEWQCMVLMDALGIDARGLWAAMEVGLIVPRQNGKGGILEALELFHLFLVKSTTLITHTAHRFDTCLDHFRRVRKLIEDTPELITLVKDNGRGIGDTPSGIKDSNGKESVELADGTRLNFKAREKGSGRGFSGDLVVLDEAFWLKDLSGLIPTMAARGNPQAWYTSSAPLPRMESDQLRKLIRDGRSLAQDDGYQRPDPDDPTLAYTEWSVPAPKGLPLAVLLDQMLEDEERIAEGNPAYGIRINRRFCKLERRRIGDEACARERFGIFPDDDDEPQWLTVPEAQWAARGEDHDGPGWLSGQVTLCVEMDKDRTRTWICVAGARAERVGIDLAADAITDSDSLVSTMLTLKKSGTVGKVLIDPRSPAGSEIQPLTDAGIVVEELSTADVVKATGSMLDGLRDDQVKHRNRPELTAAAAVAQLRKAGESMVIDRWSEPSAAPFIGCALARWGHLQGYGGPTPTLIF